MSSEYYSRNISTSIIEKYCILGILVDKIGRFDYQQSQKAIYCLGHCRYRSYQQTIDKMVFLKCKLEERKEKKND